MDVLHYWFSFVCGQNNCWHLAGQSLPICQRCAGLYVGGACALACWFVLRPKATPRMLWAHGLFLLAMIPFGYHLAPQNGEIRTVTGWLFAFGLVYYMAVFVVSGRDKTPSPHWVSKDARWRTAAYFACVGAGLLAVLAAVHFGAAWTARLLSALAVAGFLTLAVLAAITLTTLARDAVRRFSHA